MSVLMFDRLFIKEIAHLRGNVLLLLRMGHHLQLFLFGLLGFRLSRFRLREFEFLGFWILVFCHGNSPKRSADLRSSYRKLNWISNNYRRATGRRLLPLRMGFQLFVQRLQDGHPEILHAKGEPPELNGDAKPLQKLPPSSEHNASLPLRSEAAHIYLRPSCGIRTRLDDALSFLVRGRLRAGEQAPSHGEKSLSRQARGWVGGINSARAGGGNKGCAYLNGTQPRQGRSWFAPGPGKSGL